MALGEAGLMLQSSMWLALWCALFSLPSLYLQCRHILDLLVEEALHLVAAFLKAGLPPFPSPPPPLLFVLLLLQSLHTCNGSRLAMPVYSILALQLEMCTLHNIMAQADLMVGKSCKTQECDG